MLLVDACQQLLDALEAEFGLPVTADENYGDTAERMTRMYREILGPARDAPAEIERLVAKTFPGASGEMVLQRNIRTTGICPHHLLPVRYRVCAAYIPARGGKAVGLSKIARIAELLARRPILHEDYVAAVADALMGIEGCQGAACYAEGQHFCMISRGVKQHDADTVASALRGAFLEQPEARAEFLTLSARAR